MKGLTTTLALTTTILSLTSALPSPNGGSESSTLPLPSWASSSPAALPPAASPIPSPASPIPSPAPAGPSQVPGQKWMMNCHDGDFKGKRLDAVNGSVTVAMGKPDKNNAAVIAFAEPGATGPFIGQTYYISNEGALKYTNPGENPEGVTAGFSNESKGSEKGELKFEGEGAKGWKACPVKGYQQGQGEQEYEIYVDDTEEEKYEMEQKEQCKCLRIDTKVEKY